LYSIKEVLATLAIKKINKKLLQQKFILIRIIKKRTNIFKNFRIIFIFSCISS